MKLGDNVKFSQWATKWHDESKLVKGTVTGFYENMVWISWNNNMTKLHHTSKIEVIS